MHTLANGIKISDACSNRMECRPSPTSKFIHQWERTLQETGTLVSEIGKYPEVFVTEDAVDRVRDSFCWSPDKSIWQTSNDIPFYSNTLLYKRD
ncbi:hypothetical protein TNCV_1143371 [Trichonephila clavipes]|nr:hypothetical protein TNCV_1143371 [Trichonephila clavipes]